MVITRREFVGTMVAGLVIGNGGHLVSDRLLKLSTFRQPEFLAHMEQKPEAPALGAVDSGIEKTSNPSLLGSNDIYWLVTRAYMAAVAACEDTLRMENPAKIGPYHTAFGHRKLASLADHPRQLYPFWDSVNNRMDATSAAGAFQILESTWDGVRSKYDFWYPGDAFSPANQDLAFCYLHDATGGSAELMAGIKVLHQHITVSPQAFTKALVRDGREWASLPHSEIGKPTGQSTRAMWQAWTWFQWALWGQCGYRRAITHPIGADARKTDTMRWRYEKNRMHWGEDYAAEIGTPILAPENGRISMTGYDDGAGHIVCFVPEGYPELEMRSFHCTGKFPHSAGTQVKRGDAIGYTGESGIGTGPHWHVEVRIDGMAIDPRWYLGMASWFKEA
ncbi:MAG: M23 family metallopeptidase [Phormidesmis sp.]